MVFGNGINMLTNLTYADVLRPCEKWRGCVYDIVLIISGALVIALSAQVAVRLPFSPVPVTGQTFAVLVTGALLGARRGCIAVLVYIIQGAAGLPVFAMGGAGLPVLLGPTGGYIVGFVAAAGVTGLLAEKGWDRRVWTTVLAMLLGNAVIYSFGLGWLSCLTGVKGVLFVGLYPFIVGDLFKISLAAAVLPAGWKLLGLRNSSAQENKQNPRGPKN